MIRAVLTTLFSSAVALGSLAHAGTFDEADRLFALREGSLANSAASRAEYQRLLPTVANAELAYAVQQIGRLAAYEATYLLPDDNANRARKVELWSGCRSAVERLEPVAAQRTVYAYWRLTCTAQWLKYASIQDRLNQIAAIKTYFDGLIDANLEIKAEWGIDTRYYGGGIYRTLAGVYSNGLSALVREGLPNGPKATQMIDRALAAGDYPGDTTTLYGVDHFMNHRQKVEVLRFTRDDGGAARVKQEAIETIEDLIALGELPETLEPETKGELNVLRTLP